MKLHHLWHMFPFVGALCIAACSPPTVSGAWVHSGPSQVAMLQLVQGNDGSLSGSLQTVTATANHQVNMNSTGLSGRIDSNALTLSTPTFLGMGTTFSGARSGNKITLTFTTSGNVNTVPFLRSKPNEFAKLTEQFRQQQALKSEARAQEKAAVAASAADEKMRRAIPMLSAEFEQTAANDVTMTPKVDAAAARFSSLTQQARDAATERQTERDGVRRSQLSVYITQVRVETNGLNIEVESAQRQFEQHRSALGQQLDQARAWCTKSHDAVCTRLNTASERYASASAKLISAFQRASAAHGRAEAAQDTLSE